MMSTTTLTTSSLIPVRVARKTRETDDIAGFELRAVNGTPLPAFEAGAHIDVHLPGQLVRQYSLCNAPGAPDFYSIGVLRDPGTRGGSAALHDAVDEGGTLLVSPPKNHFALDEKATHTLLLAGGIGVTPLLAMAERLSVIGASFDFHYCGRSLSRMAFRDRLAASAYAHRVRVHADDGVPEQKLDLVGCLSQPAAGTHLYVCGPTGFLDAVRDTARINGWSELQIHFEYFSGVAAHSAEDRGFDVVLKNNGKVIRVEADQTIVDALSDAGVHIPVSCAQGVCGTCLTRVCEGEIDHKDLYLSVAERAANDQMLPCCSRAKGGRLVLEL